MRSEGLILALFLIWTAHAGTKPNVILIMADDTGIGDLSCYGAKDIATPNIDRLATEGMLFNQAYTPTPVCTPSRDAALAGRYPWRRFWRHNVISHGPMLLKPDELSVQRVFQKAGYKTAMFGKWHLGIRHTDDDMTRYSKKDWNAVEHYRPTIKPGPVETGFDYAFYIPVGHFFPPTIYVENHQIIGYTPNDPIKIELLRKGKRHQWTQTGGKGMDFDKKQLTTELTRRVVSYIERPRTRPFFIYVPLLNVHRPLTPHPRFVGKSKLGVYGDYILEMDWSVGEILKSLKKQGVEKETLIIFTSDNGPIDKNDKEVKPFNHDPTGGVRGDKGDAYEDGIRVPFLVRWPQVVPAGRKSNVLLMFTDLLPTFADIVGQPIGQAKVDGISVLKAFRGEEVNSKRRVFFTSRHGHYAIREGRWKYIHCNDSGDTGPYLRTLKRGVKGQLFDLEKDPRETSNLVDTHPEIAQRLRKQIFTEVGKVIEVEE